MDLSSTPNAGDARAAIVLMKPDELEALRALSAIPATQLLAVLYDHFPEADLARHEPGVRALLRRMVTDGAEPRAGDAPRSHFARAPRPVDTMAAAIALAREDLQLRPELQA